MHKCCGLPKRGPHRSTCAGGDKDRAVIKELKEIALKHGTAQLVSVQRPAPAASMSDIARSNEIAQIASMVISIGRTDNVITPPDDPNKEVLSAADAVIFQIFGWTFSPEQHGWIDSDGVLQLRCE